MKKIMLLPLTMFFITIQSKSSDFLPTLKIPEEVSQALELYKADISKPTWQNTLTSITLLAGGAFLTYKQIIRLTSNLIDDPHDFLTVGPQATAAIASLFLVTGIIAIVSGALRLKLMAKAS